MASPAAALPTDSGASSTLPASQVSAEPTLSPGAQQGSVAPSPGAAPESQNIRQLREAYEALKKEHEPYVKLGKPEELNSHVSIATKLATAAVEAGTMLGYNENEVREALANDPEGTIVFLRQKQAEAEKNGAAQSPELRGLLKEFQDLKKEIEPLKQEREQARIDKAHSTFDSAFDQQINELFKDEKPSEEELDMLYEGSFALMKRDQDAVARLVNEGKTADVARFVAESRSLFDKYYLARQAREQKRIGANNQRTGTKEIKPENLTMDKFIRGEIPESHPLAKYR